MLIPMSIAALLQSPRHESKLIIHQLISKEDVVYKYIINNICVYIHTYNGILFSHINKKNHQNPAICNNTDGPRWYFAK